jgi:hypothetical protein
MSIMSKIRFVHDDDGEVGIVVSPELKPLDELLEDIGDDIDVWQEAIDHLRHPSSEPWGFGGNSHHMVIGPDKVVIENQINSDDSVSLSRADFFEVVEAFVREINRARD